MSGRERDKKSLGDNPLSPDRVLDETFYQSSKPVPERLESKPTHYKVLSISLYREDIDRLDEMVAELKRRGFTKANRSQLIRYALDTVDLDAMPRGY